MKNASSAANKPAHITKGDVFDDIGLTRAEALEAKVKADLWRDLLAHITPLPLTQKELAKRLGVHQPEVSNLLNGKLSKFSAGTLIQYAVKLDLGVQVKLTAPKPKKGTVKVIAAKVGRKEQAHHHRATSAAGA
ncbi:MAG TPA: helix-turn-helix transcriptional regulator [Granulicella sp.]|jgi:predicted XRE-type DNA-binding protein|nr:helix-turn-helix transcriptional regulator [Granulicella sp.]